MKTHAFAFALCTIAAGCSSGYFPASDIAVEGMSEQVRAEYVYFRVPEGTECAGVRIRTEGTTRFLSFVRAISGLDVDSVAVVSGDPTWEGMLRVEVPIDDKVFEHGGEMTIALEGGGGLATLRYPGRTRADDPIQPHDASDGR